MTNKQAPKRRELPVPRIIFYTGIALILIGHNHLSVPPDACLSVISATLW